MSDKPLYSPSAAPIDRFEGEYAWLSNFDDRDVKYEGIVYPTSEHAYQAAKSDDIAERRALAALMTPSAAKKAGRNVKMRDGFEEEKLSVMKKVIEGKVERHPELAEMLVATYPALLVEGNHWHDNFWGDCRCSKCSSAPGSNMLGRILMEIRLPLVEATEEKARHLAFMREAIGLSEENVRTGDGGPFGAIIVKDGEIVGRGSNRVLADNDSTAHAEMVAIRDAERNLGTRDLLGCVAYTSCFPCPMCLGALVWANISKFYFANSKEDAAAIGFRDEAMYGTIASLAGTGEGSLFSEIGLSFEQIGRDDAIRAFEAYAGQGMAIY